FAGAVEGGRLHGRGAANMKGSVAAQAMALILLRRLKGPLARAVGFVCVADEEAGGAYGMGWVALTHPDRLRAPYCVNEGGGTFVPVDGSDWCLLGVGEKGRYEVHATFHGRGAHAARPWQGDNALLRAARALERVGAYEPERDVSGPTFPHQGPAVVEERVRALLPDADVRIDCTAVANASPADPEWIAALSDVLGQVLGRPAAVVPTISGGFTDSRFVRELGVPAYGFAP